MACVRWDCRGGRQGAERVVAVVLELVVERRVVRGAGRAARNRQQPDRVELRATGLLLVLEGLALLQAERLVERGRAGLGQRGVRLVHMQARVAGVHTDLAGRFVEDGDPLAADLRGELTLAGSQLLLQRLERHVLLADRELDRAGLEGDGAARLRVEGRVGGAKGVRAGRLRLARSAAEGGLDSLLGQRLDVYFDGAAAEGRGAGGRGDYQGDERGGGGQ